MSDGFYRAFEERFLGSRELITSRREQYVPFVQPLSKLYKSAKILDLGCGRGEWLSIMQGQNFEVFGLDLDDGMLDACRERHLPVKKGDAIEYLKCLDNESLVVISAFHVVEHISFNELRILVSESQRVLKPGGLLILETPNPENIIVATRNFYLDPTHIRPIPPLLLSFLPEYYGFNRTKILRLQESTELVNKTPNLIDVLNGVSPDYAVIAQKNATAEVLQTFDEMFNKEYGLTLETLANNYDNKALNNVTHSKSNHSIIRRFLRKLKGLLNLAN